ncbi:hypothetical protein Pelo_18556 [Pelomyxa schiedti]|nr:hypothetical protein Pelo_18556 [Pelomyxa schiedti]
MLWIRLQSSWNRCSSSRRSRQARRNTPGGLKPPSKCPFPINFDSTDFPSHTRAHISLVDLRTPRRNKHSERLIIFLALRGAFSGSFFGLTLKHQNAMAAGFVVHPHVIPPTKDLTRARLPLHTLIKKRVEAGCQAGFPATAQGHNVRGGFWLSTHELVNKVILNNLCHILSHRCPPPRALSVTDQPMVYSQLLGQPAVSTTVATASTSSSLLCPQTLELSAPQQEPSKVKVHDCITIFEHSFQFEECAPQESLLKHKWSELNCHELQEVTFCLVHQEVRDMPERIKLLQEIIKCKSVTAMVNKVRYS